MNTRVFLRAFAIVAALSVWSGAQIACQHLQKDAVGEVEKRAAGGRDALFENNRKDRAAQNSSGRTRLNLNTASREELMRLPGIGAGLAARIMEYRTRYGKFRRPEHILMVDGIGARRFVRIRELLEAR